MWLSLEMLVLFLSFVTWFLRCSYSPELFKKKQFFKSWNVHFRVFRENKFGRNFCMFLFSQFVSWLKMRCGDTKSMVSYIFSWEILKRSWCLFILLQNILVFLRNVLGIFKHLIVCCLPIHRKIFNLSGSVCKIYSHLLMTHLLL